MIETTEEHATLVARIRSIFFPFSARQLQRVQSTADLKFAHYTSAETALSIIENGEMWLRNATTMNDFSEVRHGLDCVAAAYAGPAGKQIQWVLNQIDPSLQDMTEKLFDGHTPSFMSNTYLTCVSEHSLSGNPNGRLSMWRAYAPANGVALILNTEVFGSSSDVLKSYSSPVRYGSAEEVAADLMEIGTRMAEELEYLKALGVPSVYMAIFNMLHWFVLCTKHPAFLEEQEWRVTHSPKLYPSEHVKSRIHSVRGVPQTVYKVPLKDFPDEELTGLSIPHLLHHIIIGPSYYGSAIAEALCSALGKVGVRKPEEKIRYANIPLRLG